MSAAKDTTGTWAVEAGTTLSAVQWTPEFSMPNRPSTGPAARSRTLLTEMLAAARAVDASKKDEAQKEEAEEIADGEAYLHTAEYHRWYYSQHPRDPRAKLPLGNPTGVDKAQLTEAAKAGAVKKDAAGKPPSPTSPKKEDAEGGEQASSSTTTKDEAATRVAAATVAAFEAAPVVPMPQQVVVPVVQSAAEAAAKAQSPPPPANLANGGVADQKDLSPLLRQYHEQFGTTPAPPVTQALPPAPQLQPGQQSASNIAAVSPGLTQQQQQLQQAQMQLQAQMQGQPLPAAGGAMAPMQDPMSGGGMQGGLMGAGQLQNPQQWDISAITGSVVEFACDQEGSRLVQRLAEVPFNLNTIYAEVEPHLGDLVNHPFGNYCVQKLLELGTPAQKLAVVRVMRTRAQELAVDTYGCRVLQRVLDCCTECPTADEQGNPIDLQQQQITRVMVDEVVGLVQELDGVVPQLVLDQNGNHVVQKILERLPPQRYDTSFVVSSFVGRMDLGMHCYGCRVVQKVFECCGDGTKLDGVDMTTPPQIVQKAQIALRNLIDGVMDMLDRLVVNQYGNYIVQHLIINSSRTTRTPVIMHLAPQVADLAMQKFSSNVVERMIVHGSDQERDHLVAIMCTCPSGSNPNAPAPLVHMMRDRFANYVIQKVIEMTTPNQKSNIVRAVTPFIDDIRSTTFGQHLLGRLERIGWLPAGSSGLRGFAEGGNGNGGGRGGRGGGGRGGRQNGGGDRPPRGGRGGFGQQPSVAQQQQFQQGGIQGTQQPYPQSVAQQQQQAPQTQSMGGMQQGTAAQQFQMQVQQSQQPQWAQAQTMQQPQVQQVQQMQPALQAATMQAPSMQQGTAQPAGAAQSGQVNQAVTMLQSMLQSIGATGMNPADIFNALTVVMQNQQGQARGGQAMNPADAATALQYAMSMAAQQQGQQGGAQQQGGQQPFDASQAMMLAQLIQRGQQQQPQPQQQQQQVPTNLMATGAAATGQPPAGPTTQQQLHDFAAMVEQNNQQQQQQQQQAPQQTQQLQFAQPMGATTMQTAQFQDPNQWNYFQQ